MAELSEYCVYTIVHTDLLAAAACQGGPATFRESKVWVTGRQLWQQAQTAGHGFPVLLGDATDCSRIEYWGLLTGLGIEGDATRFTIDCVRPLSGAHAPQELVLRSSGEHIAANFIRPYAICHTPEFIREAGARLKRGSSLLEMHCCEDMRREAERTCDQHPTRHECPDCLIHYSPRFQEYGLIVHDGGTSGIRIRFCPWCGSQLPESRRPNGDD